MAKIVAVEAGLDPVGRELRQQGYVVVRLEEEGWQSAGAVVITGIDSSVMNVQDIETRAPVITAAGRGTREIIDEVRRRLG